MICHQLALDFLISISRTAREIALAYYAAPSSVEVKTDRSLVTAADQKIEEELRKLALARGWGVIGEEGGREKTDAEYVLILDPIDGTNHFVTHDDNFFTLLGAHHKTDGFVAGLCEQPVTGKVWTGLKGSGAYAQKRNKKGELVILNRLTSPPCKNIGEAILASYNPMLLKGADRAFYEEIAARAKANVPGGDAGNYARLADGYIQVVLDPVGGLYDVAALMPILHEAGACIRKLNADGSVSEITMDLQGPFTTLAASDAGFLQTLADLRVV